MKRVLRYPYEGTMQQVTHWLVVEFHGAAIARKQVVEGLEPAIELQRSWSDE